MTRLKTVVILGGGAAGFFGAIACAQANSCNRVVILEKTRQVLAKVKVSGGGRCNVTHACFEPALLVKNYPRGGLALRGPFSRFQPRDTIEWFETRGVHLKIEADGRIFPCSDSSTTIIDCFMNEAKAAGVEIWTEWAAASIKREENGYLLSTAKGDSIHADDLIVCTGSTPRTYEWLKALGHTIIPSVPSLFTFNVPSSPFLELAGVSVSEVSAKIEDTSLVQEGPVLMTHWGFSGPAILKLSAWGARILHDLDYRAVLSINWLPRFSEEEIRFRLEVCKQKSPSRLVVNECPFTLPKQLWKKLVVLSGISSELKWVEVSKKHLHSFIAQLRKSTFQIEGKSTYKEEFVTCGGIDLNEVNFKTMESRICPRLYFAGEVLDIDGVTGGFNFQNAWTTSWIAAHAIASH